MLNKKGDIMHKPKILVLDIETAPSLGYFWSIWNTNIGISQLVNTSKVICFAAKWLGDKKVHFYSDHNSTHKKVVKEAWDLVNEADAIIGYNSQPFDMKVLNREFLLEGMPKPDIYKNIDLLKTVKSNFRFVSNKLDHVSQELGIGKKTSHQGFDLWQSCMNGDSKAWKLMEKYNKNDVKLTEELYRKLQGWIVTPFNFNDHSSNDVCPNCGSIHIIKNGIYRSRKASYQKYKCNKCFSHSRSASMSKDKRKDSSVVRL